MMNFLKKFFSKDPDLLPGESKDGCENCYWKAIKRHQKCSCCRRNANLKDNYVFSTEAGEEEC